MYMRYLSMVVLSIFVTSCFSIKPQVSKTGSNLWEDFFVSPGVMQYFIKPLSFYNNDRSIEIDFTFRNISDSVTVNYSIYSKTASTQPETVLISNGLTTVSIIAPSVE